MVTTSAGSKIAGYTFQFERALYRLFSSEEKETIVGIETDDDVVEIKLDADGSLQIIFEQDKHSIQEAGQPFQDSSKNLWHTLHIWLDAQDGARKKYNKICYCLVTNKDVPLRAFARKLGTASNSDQIAECIKEIRARAQQGLKENSKDIKAVAKFSDDELYFLIENLKLMDEYATASGSTPKDATIQLFQLSPDLQEKGEGIYNSLLGLLVDTCQTSWINKEQVWLNKATFTKRLQLEIQAHRMERYVERNLMSTKYAEYLKNNENNNHFFLTQLQYLGVPTGLCDRALSHYWGFYAERVRLQSEGDVLPNAWDSRDEELHQRWQMISDNIRLNANSNVSEEAVAKNIFTETLNPNYTAKLGLHETSYPYFTSGNYHDLANKLEYTFFIHWHSKFAPKDE